MRKTGRRIYYHAQSMIFSSWTQVCRLQRQWIDCLFIPILTKFLLFKLLLPKREIFTFWFVWSVLSWNVAGSHNTDMYQLAVWQTEM